jgi:nucleoside-diphosphate-sugar epimerase
MIDNVIVGDIIDPNTIDRIEDKEFDAIVNLISLDHHKSEGKPNYVSSVNVLPTWKLLDKFTKYRLKKFINLSTIHVYGEFSTNVINENHLTRPMNKYALTHLLSENICNYFNKTTDTHCINIRLSNTFGSPLFKDNNCWWLVINELCKTLYEKKEIKLKSDGTPQRDFIHIDDVVNSIDILLNHENKSDKIT